MSSLASAYAPAGRGPAPKRNQQHLDLKPTFNQLNGSAGLVSFPHNVIEAADGHI